MITRIDGLTGNKIDWVGVGRRVLEYRTSKNWDLLSASENLGLTDHQLSNLESIEHRVRERKDVKIIFLISQKWDLSLNWLLNGIGSPHAEDPHELIPQTLIVQKGAGINPSKSRTQAQEGHFDDEVLEFVLAIDKYKQCNDIPFPTYSQIFEIALALGYRKTGPVRIAPLGFIIKDQEEIERLNQINEKNEQNWIGSDDLPENRKPETQLIPLLTPTKPVEAKRAKSRRKKRLQRQMFLKTSNLSDLEKERRRKIGEKTRIRGKKYLLTSPEGREYIIDSAIESVPDFCKAHDLMPAHIYGCASGARPQHKGWTVQIIMQEMPSGQD